CPASSSTTTTSPPPATSRNSAGGNTATSARQRRRRDVELIGLAVLCVAVASVIGGATGFGTSLMATPFMLMVGIGLTETVVVNLVVALVTRVGVTYQLREHIDWRRVALLGGASLPGAWLGVETVSMLP